MTETTDTFVTVRWGMPVFIASWMLPYAIQVIKMIKYLHSANISNVSFVSQEAGINVITEANAWKDVASISLATVRQGGKGASAASILMIAKARLA